MDIWELNMEHCKFDMATKNDIDKVLEIYNSTSGGFPGLERIYSKWDGRNEKDRISFFRDKE